MKKITLDKFVLVSAWIFQAIQYTRVFMLLDGGVLGLLSGITGGIMAASGITYIASRAPKVKAKKAQIATWAALGLILAITPVLVTYANLASLTGITANVARHVYSIAAAVVADAFIAGVAFAGGSLVRVDEPQPAARATAPKRKARRNATAWPRKCAQCGEVVTDAGRMGAHVRFAHPKPVAIDRTLLIKKDGE